MSKTKKKEKKKRSFFDYFEAENEQVLRNENGSRSGRKTSIIRIPCGYPQEENGIRSLKKIDMGNNIKDPTSTWESNQFIKREAIRESIYYFIGKWE